ncbi:MAG: phosphonate ABC transporter, permease protein PhnE [Anaerolineae bacterium]
MTTSANKTTTVRTDDIEQIRREVARPLPRLSLTTILAIIIALAVLGWGINGTQARPERIINGIPALVRFVSGLMPPEFEFGEGSERAIRLSDFSVRELDRVPKAERAKKASDEEIANLAEGQRVLYTLQVTKADPLTIITADQAAAYNPDEVEGLRPYIVDAGMTIALDDWDQSVMVIPEGMHVVNAVPYHEGEMVVAKRYILEPGEILIGYPIVLDSVLETVQIAVIGTIGAIIAALPFALLAARNISPHPLIYQGVRLLLNINRSIPTLIWALIMVSAVGLGPFAGVMALIIGSIGSTARLYAESFEQIDPNQVAAVRATGAGSLHVFIYSVLPQAFPLLATYSLVGFEVNVRESTILGIVGAGGVGFIIQKYTALFQFQRLMGTVIIIAILVTLIDRVSAYIRKQII